MKAEILAVGTELLMGQVVNTNAAEIARMLAEIGIGVYYQSVIGDNAERLADALRTALRRTDVVVVCGGLGPTEDDLTRETLAAVLDRPLHRDEGWERHLREMFAARRWGTGPSYELPANNLRQTMVPEGAELLPNTRGTAPGIYLEHQGTAIALVPGPPREMRGLMEDEVLPRLARLVSDRWSAIGTDRSGAPPVLRSRVLRVIGLGESRMAEILQDILAAQSNPTIAPLAQLGEVHLRLTAHGASADSAEAMLETTAREIYAVLGDAIYGEDRETLELVAGRLLRERGLTITVAESCTGGLVCHRLTNVPGSSAYLLGGAVTYSNELKSSLLGVDPALIAREGAVSESVARAMAEGARREFGSDLALAITGIAGPDGGTATKPVGLTFIALAGDAGAAGGAPPTKGRGASSTTAQGGAPPTDGGGASSTTAQRGAPPTDGRGASSTTARGGAPPTDGVAPAVPAAPATLCREFRFNGEREVIKERAAHTALAMLREALRVGLSV